MKLVNTWPEIQNYTCKPVLLDSAQATCVKKSHLQLLAIASLHYILSEHFESNEQDHAPK